MRIIYTLLYTMLMPLVMARLFWRSRNDRGYRQNIGERFGFYHQSPLRRCIWIHAVSVGETRAAEPLIRRLRILLPERRILLTCMTPTGRATALELFGSTVICGYLPYDLNAFHQRLIDHFDPSVLIIMETEVWPNLLHACHLRAIPSLLVNARLSERSARGYARIAAVTTLVRQALQSVRVVAAQSDADADRFRALGAREIVVMGNIKFDVALDAAQIARGENWRAVLRNRRVLLCASTREGEEEALLAAYAQVFDAHERYDTLLVVVPRHPQRFDRVAGDIRRAGLRLARRSSGMAAGDESSRAEVLLGDSMGEMAAYYSFCDVAVIGGSFQPLGGQNLIEACAAGKPAIMGPSTFNFSKAAQLAEAAGAMLLVDDPLDAMRSAQALLGDYARLKQMSDAGRRLVEAHRGMTDKVVALVEKTLAEG
jgi:3-deoxy-D-manno-octulosonic-acid transferase